MGINELFLCIIAALLLLLFISVETNPRGAESRTANSNLAAPMTTSTSASTTTTTTTTAAGPSIVRIADEETELEVLPQREEQRIQDRLTRNNRNLAEYIRRAALEDQRLDESRAAAPGGS